MEDFFFESYLKFFKNAEAKRRWSIDWDVPWYQVNPESSDLSADIVQFFSAVELFLPDYTSKMMLLIRRSRGRAWFHANWGYEESKHSMVLEKWLLQSGKRTPEQIADFERTILGAEWDLPFDHPRQMIIYTMIQELATGINYTNLRRRAKEENDGALAGLLRWVAADESAHYNFFRKGVKAYLELEPDDTVKDLKFVFDHFAMPAQSLIPGWDELSARVDAAGIYGPRQYLQKVRLPILEDLGITRQQLKQAGLDNAQADAIADRAEQGAADRRDTEWARTYFVPKLCETPPPPGRRRVFTYGGATDDPAAGDN